MDLQAKRQLVEADQLTESLQAVAGPVVGGRQDGDRQRLRLPLTL